MNMTRCMEPEDQVTHGQNDGAVQTRRARRRRLPGYTERELNIADRPARMDSLMGRASALATLASHA